MSYSISTTVEENFDVEKISVELQKEINEETLKLRKNGFNIYTETVFINDEIPYNPNLPFSIGISIHMLDDISLNYYLQKIIDISKKYNKQKISKDLDILHTIIYYDDEKNYVISNENWKKYSHIKNTIYDNRFSLIEKPNNSLIKKMFQKIHQRNFNKIKKILTE